MSVGMMLATITVIRYFKELNAMTRRYLKILLVGSLFTLSACAQQTEVRQMKQSVNTLNTAMDKLNKETVKITQQNALNAKSTSGVYLLPGANTLPVSTAGWHVKMSLVNVAANADGTRATLRIQGESNDPLPAFSGTVEWARSEAPPRITEVNVKNQLFTAPASVLAPSDVDIPLQLSGLTPDQLGFIRIHDIQPAAQ